MMSIKMKMNSLLVVAALFVGSLGVAQTTQMPPQEQQAQIEVNDQELAKFATAYQGIMAANQEIQQQMISTLETEGMEIQRFNEIHQAKVQNQEVEATPEELEQHGNVTGKLEGMQADFQKNIEGIITEADLTVERYQQIATALQNDTALQQRLQEIMVG